MINSYQVIQNLSILQCMWNQSEEQIFVFRIKLFSYLISKTFVYKITWYHEVFQIITHQGRGTNLVFLQGYLESTACKRISLCFDFSYLERERERESEREREREREREICSHFGSSAAPLLGGLCRLLASGGRCGVDPRLSTLGEPSHLPQRCLSKTYPLPHCSRDLLGCQP